MSNDKTVCYGAGVIGSSWATCFSLHERNVVVYDLKEDYLILAKSRIHNNLQNLSQQGYLAKEAIEEIESKISYTTNVAFALQSACFVQESVPEVIDLKQNVIFYIDKYAPKDCIAASSTSGMRITDITANSKYPERYIGAHPFNPPHLIPLVEITKGECTTQDTIDRAVLFYKSVKREPVVLNKEVPGFIANRFQHAVLREMISLVTEDVCSIADADRALTYGPGLRWAAIGQGMIGELASENGAETFNRNFKPVSEAIFSDLSNMTEIPENWLEKIGPGVKAEFSQLPDEIGHNRKDVADFRDKILLNLLHLHGKI